MRSLILATALIGTAASAQLVGNVGGAVGAVGQSATGSVGATVDPGPVTSTVRDTTRATTEAARATVNARDRAAVRVEVGASHHVDRGARCYCDDYYYDPVYRDGYYYCERTGTQTGTTVKAGVAG